MIDILIDEVGDTWEPCAERLRQRVGARIAREAIPDFFVRNRGYVRLTSSSSSFAIRAHPRHAQYRTFVALMEILENLDAQQNSLTWISHNNWHHEIIPSTNALRKRLWQLIRTTRTRKGKYLSEAVSLGALAHAEPFSNLLEAWQETDGFVDTEPFVDLMQRTIAGKYSILTACPNSGRLIFSDIGQGYLMYRPGWHQTLVGSPAEDQPDFAYGRAVADEWRASLLKGEPGLTYVDAIISDPVSRQDERWRYRRLTLPLTRNDGSLFLLTVTQPWSNIDLRIELQDDTH